MTMKDRELDLSTFRARLEAEEGPRYWRSLEELSEDENFREYLFEEFPRQAAPMGEGSDRRSFMKLMGASFALAGLAGCRAPVEHIVPYVNKPEEILPGRPLFFATAMSMSGVATGLLVESHEGRPTKIEGNPEHPASLGASGVFHQASVLDLYDPDRSPAVRYLGEVATWGDFLTALQRQLEQTAGGQGGGVRILTETITSPTLGAQIEALLARFPGTVWHQYEPLGASNVREGAQLAFGRYVDTIYQFDRANVIFSLDSDFLGAGPAHLRYTRQFADRRRVSGGAQTMNRLYAIGPTLNVTAGMADNRLPVRALDVEDFARQVAAGLGIGMPSGASGPHAAWTAALVKDLQANRGASVVIAGDGQPPAVHALAHAMNQALGNVGSTVTHIEPVEVQPVDQLASLRQLVVDMNGGIVRTLVMLGGNPVFTAPVDFDFPGALAKVPFRAHLSPYYDETSERSHWHIPEAHYLESWGDVRAFDGTVSIVQPLIAPLYNGKTATELVGALLSDMRSAHDMVQERWMAQLGGEEGWRRVLHDGLVPNTALPATSVAVTTVPPPTQRPGQATALELIFTADSTIYDGRFANNAWLQELPKPMTKLVWDNVAMVSPATAARLGVANEDVIELTFGGRRVHAPVWVMPGQADESVMIQVGHGRTRAGRVGNGTGFNAYSIRPSNALSFGPGLRVRKTGDKHKLACTQGHHRMEGRQLIRAATLGGYLQNPAFAKTKLDLDEHPPDLYPEFRYDEYRWGMTVDTSVCVGCNGCVAACQAENNISTVGKKEVLRQREMHWLRIDRYFEGPDANPQVLHQAVLCMHCEKAPCEPVCPVEATSHSDDGLNDMTYNRCVGTRYCSNNCPYKVRRFNFFQYADFETESLKLGRNPDVTVRSRGVMEKCTFCVQRIRRGRRAAEKEGRRVGDGEIVTACQAACPSQAISFGDLND
ncbi:MAG TPA: TAT-variant-translocated molybdopterin oxidoreductase, partial [Longimicrobiales bacterium]|nr:TAT-variant-translocated molybdopterin oxidoreductase [Longimicrobiales bacterium]